MNGEMSAEVHSSMLRARVGEPGDDPKEKFLLNIFGIGVKDEEIDEAGPSGCYGKRMWDICVMCDEGI